MTEKLRADVLVVGGGPAGLAAAIAARMKGFSVTVMDGARPPIDKACGEGILPAGVEALRRLGVPPEDAGFRLRGVRFIGNGTAVEAAFCDGWGLALRRVRLHDLMVSRASDLGVQFRWGTSSRNIAGLACRWIVGADGQQSLVRHEARLDASRTLSTRFGFRRHYQLAPWTDKVEVHWGVRCQVYVTPVSGEETGVALLTRDPHLRLDSALEEFPALVRRLRNAPLGSTERGSTTVSRRLRRVFRGRTVLAGDASGSVDAITGEGLSLAFLQAFALAEGLASGDLNAYQTEHRRLSRRAAAMSNALLLMDRFPWLRGVVLRGLAREPAVFRRLLAIQATGSAM